MRLIVYVAAAICGAWLRSPTRRALRSMARARTVRLLEQVDEDARELREVRDEYIPLAFRALAEEKQRLIDQLARFTDGDAPVPVPLPDPVPSSSGGWSPNLPGRAGPLFHQRTFKQ